MAASRVVLRPLRLLLVAAVLSMVPVTAPAGAQSEPTPTTTAFDLSNCTGAIARPGCGEEPESAGDRGGALQLGLFLFIALGTAAGLVYVASRVRKGTRARAEAVSSDWS